MTWLRSFDTHHVTTYNSCVRPTDRGSRDSHRTSAFQGGSAPNHTGRSRADTSDWMLECPYAIFRASIRGSTYVCLTLCILYFNIWLPNPLLSVLKKWHLKNKFQICNIMSFTNSTDPYQRALIGSPLILEFICLKIWWMFLTSISYQLFSGLIRLLQWVAVQHRFPFNTGLTVQSILGACYGLRDTTNIQSFRVGTTMPHKSINK